MLKSKHIFINRINIPNKIVTNQLNSDEEAEDLPDAIKAAGSSRAGAVGNVGDIDGDGEGIVKGAMDVDQDPMMGASISSSSKRKHTLLNTGTHSMSSSHAISAPTTIASSEPASKKLNSSKGKQPAGKVTQTTILHGMQGTMNQVTDIFE
jgi:hypothetical protein